MPPDLRPMEDYLATHDTSILMYNRVPKTGSSSMRTMLINLAKVGDHPSKLKGCLGWLSLSVCFAAFGLNGWNLNRN